MPRDLTDLEARLKPEVFTLESLVAWLDRQPFWKPYNYGDIRRCLLAQYFRASGLAVVAVNPWAVAHGDDDRQYTEFPTVFNEIAIDGCQRFGFARWRAKRALLRQRWERVAGIGAMLGGR